MNDETHPDWPAFAAWYRDKFGRDPDLSKAWDQEDWEEFKAVAELISRQP